MTYVRTVNQRQQVHTQAAGRWRDSAVRSIGTVHFVHIMVVRYCTGTGTVRRNIEARGWVKVTSLHLSCWQNEKKQNRLRTMATQCTLNYQPRLCPTYVLFVCGSMKTMAPRPEYCDSRLSFWYDINVVLCFEAWLINYWYVECIGIGCSENTDYFNTNVLHSRCDTSAHAVCSIWRMHDKLAVRTHYCLLFLVFHSVKSTTNNIGAFLINIL